MGPRRFMGEVEGEGKTSASRLSNTNIYGHIRGWDTGVKIHGYINESGEDSFEIWTTNGSNDDTKKKLVAVIMGGEICEVGLVER